jgi:diadenosine tetraphosphate (Ap4A) HIT family hydrolase
MSSWTDSAQWQRYLSPECCPVCNQTPETRPPTERSIADLSVSRFISDIDTCLKGWSCLVLKPHVIELYELSDEDSAAFMRDARVASLALKKVTGAVKLNYEIHGNTIPHLHMHLYPRQIGDRFENGPIDWRHRTSTTYEDGEFEAFIERMKAAVQEVEHEFTRAQRARERARSLAGAPARR